MSESAQQRSATPLPLPLGEVAERSEDGEGAMAERLPIGKRNVCTATCLFPPPLIRLRRPLSPVGALGTSPKRGSASRGEGWC